MIKFEKALKLVLQHTQTLSTARVAIEDAIGMILDEDVISTLEMPPFNKSAMDGYALRAMDSRKGNGRLKCIGILQPGEKFTKRVGKNECVKIMTGAPIPLGADSVVMVENTKQTGSNVGIFQEVRKGENICRRGEDLKKGQCVLKKLKKISVSDISCLASVGRQFVKVKRKPRIAILNTGNEIVPGGKKLGQNKIFNSNGPQLSTLLKADHIECTCLGIAKDNPRALKVAMAKGLTFDGLLISGGVSMGDYDLVPKVLKSLGVKEIFHDVKMKPGKPLFFGKKKNKVIFGIPGNPVSNFVIYHLFIRSALKKMMGYKTCEPIFEKGILKKKYFNRKKGRKRFIPVNVYERDGRNFCVPLSSHGSADILTLSQSDGFMVVGEKETIIKEKSGRLFFTWKSHQ